MNNCEEVSYLGREQEQCRICYNSSESNAALLNNVCKCKGSLGHVHQECLEHWLNQQNTKQCEVCKTYYRIIEENGSLKEILQVVLKNLRNRRRFFKLCIYFLYLYLFLKRLVQVLKFFNKLSLRWIRKTKPISSGAKEASRELSIPLPFRTT